METVKIRLDFDGKVFEFEKEPMSPERFAAVCKLAGAAIGGAVFLGVVHLVGFWAVPWAVGALALVGVYKLLKAGF